MDPDNSKGGGETPKNPQNQELIDLKDQYEQQEVLISQLKEMLHKSEQTTVTVEKVKEYANTLNRMRAKTKQGRMQEKNLESNYDVKKAHGSGKISTVNIQAKEKILLLRQQLEENKAKLAQRDKNHKGLEERVIQLKAQLDDSQQFINQTTLNFPFLESKVDNFNSNSSSEELYNALILKEKRLSDLNAKVVKLEANILDLQENLKEKDSVIDARTKAIALMSENLSKKGKHTLDELEDTKDQMRKMQENFVSLELQLNTQKQNLLKQLKEKNSEIEQLQKSNTQLLTKNLELENAIKEYQLSKKNKKSETNLNSMQFENQILELNKIINERDIEIEFARKQILELEKKLEENLKQNSNLHNKLNELNKCIQEKEQENVKQLDRINDLEENIRRLNEKVGNSLKIEKESENLNENEEVTKLKKQLDDYNKNMIKVKAQHKIKLKELNKKIEDFKKISDVNAEIVKFHTENYKLKQQIAELETKLKENENKSESTIEIKEKNSVISLEEEIQIYKLEIKALKEQLENFFGLENAQVTSEINSIHLEERIDNLEALNKQLENEKENMAKEHLNLLEKIDELKREKQDISQRWDQCLQENMELMDKLEKMSAEKVSSAESIEFVESLTQQEKLELEEYQKRLGTNSDNIKSEEHLEQNPELNEGVNQLTEETSDLLRKIELFAEERREVMEKMESLTTENNLLLLKIKEVENNQDILAETYEQLQNEKEDLDNKLEELQNENDRLKIEIDHLKEQNQFIQKSSQIQEIKHGNIVEDDMNLEIVAPLESSNTEDINKKLQEEIVEYKSLIEIQKQEIKELKLQLLSSNTSDDLKQEVATLGAQYEALLSENQKLKEAVKNKSELAHEKDNIEEQLQNARKQINDLEIKFINVLEDINSYKQSLEEKRNELDSSNNKIIELQNEIEGKKLELLHYENTVNHLNSVVSDLTNNSNELQSVKQIFDKNIQQIEEYKKELEKNTETITSLEGELKKLNFKLLETEHLLELKDGEMRQLIKENENKATLISNLQEEIKNKEDQFHKVCDQLRERCLTMQIQIEQNIDSINDIRNPLEEKIRELEHKNKEQLEKMKKLAANFKKKTTLCQELETAIADMKKTIEDEMTEKEKYQIEISKKDEDLLSKENEIKSLQNRIGEITDFYEGKIKDLQILLQEIDTLKEKEKLIQELQIENIQFRSQINQHIAINNDLQNIKTEYETQINALSAEIEIIRSNMNNTLNTEIIQKDETITNLNQQLETQTFDYEIRLNASQTKIQELELFIETQETELSKYKEKANKLEEVLSVVEERRVSLEKKAVELGSQLENKLHKDEDISHTEDILQQRLSALIIHDEIIEKRLQETVHENQELVERNRFLLEENAQLRDDLSSTSGKIVDVSDFINKISILENENTRLTNIIMNSENEIKHLQTDFNKKILEKEQELESLESELQNQVEINSNERKILMAQIEQLQDQLKESKENLEILQEEIKQYKNEFVKKQNELQSSLSELEQLRQENQNNLSLIQQLQIPLQNNANSSDNLQMVIQNLQTEIEQKNAQIVEYHKQNLQLQMQTSNSQDSVLQIIRNEQEIKDTANQLLIAQKKIENLQTEKCALENKTTEMTNTITNLKDDLIAFKKLYTEEISKNLVEEILTLAEKDVTEKNIPTGKEIPARKEIIAETISSRKNQMGKEKVQLFEEKNKKQSLAAEVDNVDDSFEFITEPSSQLKHVKMQETSARSKSSSNIMEELKNKIKTLEFILFNAEKDKDDALSQCNHLTNELAKLVYEKEESETLKSSYQQLQTSIETGIISVQDMQISEQDQRQLKNIEFSPVCFLESNDLKPVEDVIPPPKTAYLEYNTQENQKLIEKTPPLNVEIFDENDDGWAWGPEEAKLEEEHMQKTIKTVQTTSPNIDVRQLEEKNCILELDRKRHLEEIKQLQIKCGKLIKKFKELKNQNDKLIQKLKTDGFDGLESAIQDELKSQIKNLEKRIEQVHAELEKEKQEKINLLKQIDVLTASHKRILEMKEKQDIEILDWQQRNCELNARLEQLEWDNDDPETPKKVQQQQQNLFESDNEIETLQGKINELNETIKELTLDNEELQILLEEQRNLRITVEKSKPVLGNMKTETEYLSLLSEKNNLQEKLNAINEANHDLNLQLKSEMESKIELEKIIDTLYMEKSELEKIVSQNSSDILHLQNQMQAQHILQEKIGTLEQEKAILMSEIQSLNTLVDQFKSNNMGFDDLTVNIETLNKEKSELFNALQEKNIQIENLNDTISALSKQKIDLEKQLDNSKQIERNLQIQLLENSNELNTVKSQFNNSNALLQQLEELKAEFLDKSEECRLLQNNLFTKSEECEKLQDELKDKSNKCNTFETEFKQQSEELERIKREFTEKSQQLDNLTLQITEKDAEYENKLSITVQQLAKEWAERVDQRGTDVAESWKLHLESRETEFMELELQLRKEIFQIESKFNALINENNELRKNVDAEIRNEVDRISALQQQIHDSQQTIAELTKNLEEKQHETDSLKQQINDYENELQNITVKLQDKVKEHSSFAQLLKDKEAYIDEIKNSFDKQLNEKQQLYDTLQQEFNSLQYAFNDNLHSVDQLSIDKKNYITSLTQQLEETNISLGIVSKTISALEYQVKEKEERIAILLKELEQKQIELNWFTKQNGDFQALLDEIHEKGTIIEQMKIILSEKEHEFSHILESKLKEQGVSSMEQTHEISLLKQQLFQTENHYEELLRIKESDIRNLKISLQEQENKNDLSQKEITLNEIQLKERLKMTEEECEALNKKLHENKLKYEELNNTEVQLEQNRQLLEGDSKQLEELQHIIENQVIKIEKLKQELFEKSKDYDSLIAEMDMRDTPKTPLSDSVVESQMIACTIQESPHKEVKQRSDNDSNNLVSRAELDLALYMLHQRDVRCEELTIELMQLLEERDTLQLKLSNALREKEDLRSRILAEDNERDETPTEKNTSFTTGAVLKSKSSAIVLGATGTELATEATEQLNKTQDDLLSDKLLELKYVGYRKDKTIVDEQERRRLQQFALMQQYQELGAMLPPEAAAKLVQDADYTLSRDVQSPSKVLLNWLWGRSTPKVNEI